MSTIDVRVLSPDDTISIIIQQILSIIHPSKVILFGSAARNQMTPNSDLDILVIVPGPVNRRQIEQQIYSNLRGIFVPVDIVVATEEDISKYGDKIGMVYRSALVEGKIVYET